MHKPLFALIDCNNFFVSCEKVFRPDLEGHPCVVASSNDGCVVARSAEARALGVPMGAPIFKHKPLFEEHKIKIFSANFELYGDISRRITEILTSITPRLEVYSIDESFLDIAHLDIADYTEWGTLVRDRISQWVGVPVSIGIAPTKTLAKLAAERAKKDPTHGGVLHLTQQNTNEHLEKTRLEDIWGIGWRSGPKLRARGLSTALDIAQLTPDQGRALFRSVQGERMIRELQGQSCLPLEHIAANPQMASATRTFGQDTSELHVLEAAMASFAARSAHRLRSHNVRARRVSIFLQTNKHKIGFQSFYSEAHFAQPTADTGYIGATVTDLVGRLYTTGMSYHRAGITLYDLEPDKAIQSDLLGYVDLAAHDRATRRMRALDTLNDTYGRRMVHFASEDLALSWEPQKRQASPRYTTNWQELPKIKIKS